MAIFYSLGNQFKRDALHLQSIEKVDFYKLFWGEHQGVKFPIKLKKLQGSKAYDFIQCGAASFILISEKVKELLKSNSISGWSTYNVEIPPNINFDQRYYGLSITGRSGPIENEKSVPTRMSPKVPNGPEYTAHLGLYFDEKTKDDVDLFSPIGTTYIFANERTKEIFEKNSITNCIFQPICKMENFNLKTEYNRVARRG